MANKRLVSDMAADQALVRPHGFPSRSRESVVSRQLELDSHRSVSSTLAGSRYCATQCAICVTRETGLNLSPCLFLASSYPLLPSPPAENSFSFSSLLVMLSSLWPTCLASTIVQLSKTNTAIEGSRSVNHLNWSQGMNRTKIATLLPLFGRKKWQIKTAPSC